MLKDNPVIYGQAILYYSFLSTCHFLSSYTGYNPHKKFANVHERINDSKVFFVYVVIFERQMSLVVTSLYHIMLLAYYLIATYFVLGEQTSMCVAVCICMSMENRGCLVSCSITLHIPSLDLEPCWEPARSLSEPLVSSVHPSTGGTGYSLSCLQV